MSVKTDCSARNFVTKPSRSMYRNIILDGRDIHTLGLLAGTNFQYRNKAIRVARCHGYGYQKCRVLVEDLESQMGIRRPRPYLPGNSAYVACL